MAARGGAAAGAGGATGLEGRLVGGPTDAALKSTSPKAPRPAGSNAGVVVLIPGEVIPGEVIPGEVNPGEVTPGEVIPGEVTPGEVVPG